MRLFVAVNLDPSVRDLIASALASFPVASPPWRWTRPETWHVTLKFLGELPPPRAGDVERCLDAVAARHRAFDLELGGFGGFPGLGRPRVLFYEAVRGAESLEGLAGDVDESIAATLGLPRETKRFHAHVTVARVKRPLGRDLAARLREVPRLVGASQVVESFDLVSSRLLRDGARYEVLKEFALQGGA